MRQRIIDGIHNRLSETDCGHGEDVVVGLLLEERDRHAAAEHIFSATRYN